MGNITKSGTPAKKRGRKPSKTKADKDNKPTVKTSDTQSPQRDRVTAYMATFPSREEFLKKSVPSIAHQVDRLVIWVNGDMQLPDECFAPNIDIYYGLKIIGQDLGCAGKFAFAFEWDGYVFTVDDDIVYPDFYVDLSIRTIEKYHRKHVFSYHGRIQQLPATHYRNSKGVVKNLSFLRDVTHDTDCHLIGTGVTFFHTDTIKPAYDIMEMMHSNISDIYFSMSMDMRGIKTVVAAHKAEWFGHLEPTIAICKNTSNERFHIDLINLHPFRQLENLE